MKRQRTAPSACLLLCLLGLALAPQAARADLASDIKTVLGDKLLQKADVGVQIVRLGDKAGADQTLFEHRADAPLVPASNLKLVTTAAALEKLGPTFKFQTALLLLPDGNLVLVGDGDPALGDAEYLKKAGWQSTTLFERWAAVLKDRRRLSNVNDVIVDDSVYDDQFLHPRWPADQVHKRYVPQVGGLNFNANCVDFQVAAGATGRTVTYALDPATRYVAVRNTCVSGNENKIWLSRENNTNDIILRGEAKGSTQVPVSVTIHDPGLFTGTVLAEVLSSRGVRRAGTVRREHGFRAKRDREGDEKAGWQVVGVHETPLTTVLARTNKDSMNLYAESLCKRIGREASKPSGDGGKAAGSWASGTAAIAEFMTKLGADAREFSFDDGCGLSRQNVISARALNKVLAHEYHGRSRQQYMASLSIAGVDGTLDDRFKSNDLRDLRGRVVGKSGYINGVRTLSGYLRSKDGQHYAFSILMNRIPDDPGVKVLQEKILKAVDAHSAALAAG